VGKGGTRTTKRKSWKKGGSPKSSGVTRANNERTDQQPSGSPDATTNGNQGVPVTEVPKEPINVATPPLVGGAKPLKSVEDMLREEQAELERLKGELGEAQ